MEIGAVLSEAWELYRRFFTRFVAVAAVVYLVVGLVDAVTSLAADEGAAAAVFWGLISLVVSIVGVFWLQGALVETVRDVRDGRADVPLGQLFARVRPMLPALVVAGLLAALGIGLGLLLLVVPGLFLLTRWLVVVPAIVLEGRSAGEAFSRSWELVKGRSWSVFGLILVTFLILIAASAIVGVLVAVVLAPLPDFLGDWLGSAVVSSLVAPFVALCWTLAYYRLAGEPEPAVAAP